MAKVVIQVTRNPNENNSSLLRRFTRKERETGVVRGVKNNRYNKRKESKLKMKRSALKKMATRKNIEKMKKLGKMK